MKPFFVTGMPRSRTAWMAAWLTTDKTLCFHDVEVGIAEKAMEFAHIGRGMGYSGPEVCLLAQKFPAVPCVIIHRPKAEAFPSFWEIVRRCPEVTLSEAQLSAWWDEREKLIGGLPGKHVSFSLLNNEETMRNLWQYLLPETPFDAERFRLMRDLNITQDTFGRKAREWPLRQ